MSTNATVSVILYKSKTLANGEHPIMLRVTLNGKRKYISMGISCHKNLWDEKNQKPKRKHPHKEIIESIISDKLQQYQSKKLEYKSDKKEYTPESIVEAVEHPTINKTVYQFFEFIIQTLKESNKVGNSQVYQDTYNSIKKANKNRDFTFTELDVPFLNRYERYLRANDLTDNAISVRFRTLRSLFNKAIEENIVKEIHYPFKKFKVSKFNNDTIRRAITKADIKKLEQLDLDQRASHREARDYFLFSYYGAGINFSDIAQLKWQNITEGRIIYKRAKTGKNIHFKLLQPALDIIEYWRPVTSVNTNEYVFPILKTGEHVSATQIDNRIHKVITRVNKHLKELGKEIGLQIPLTTYVARHSFATALKNSGVQTRIISESMGHQNESVTETYLKSFDNDVMDDAMKNLL